MPLPTSPCQRCGEPLTWRVVDGLPAPFEASGALHRPRCTAAIRWGQARSVEEPRLISPVVGGYIIGIDLETTGIPGRIEDPEIVEIAAALLRMEDGAIVHTFSQLVKPRGPLLAQEVHQITPPMLEDAPYIEEAITRFGRWRRLMQETYQQTPIPLVSHNAAFELSFLDPCDVEGPWICTLIMSQSAVSGRQPRGYHSLGTIVERMGLSYDGAPHRALPDAKICAEVYWMMTRDAQDWRRLTEVVTSRLGDARAALATAAPVTADLLLKVEKEMMRRLRLFQERPRQRGPSPELPDSWRFPWEPPEVEEPWPYRFYDRAAFAPLPLMLQVIRRVYRAERMGITLGQLAQLRSRPEFEASAEEAPARLREELPAEPERRAPVQPEFSPQLDAPLQRGGLAAQPAPDLQRRAPHAPTFSAPPPEEAAAPEVEATPPRAAPVQPVFTPRRQAGARPPIASESWPPPRPEAQHPARVAPIKPRFDGGKG